MAERSTSMRPRAGRSVLRFDATLFERSLVITRSILSIKSSTAANKSGFLVLARTEIAPSFSAISAV